MVIATATLLLGLASSASAATPTWLTGETIEPTAQASINGLSCPSAVTCLAAADNTPVVQDNGLSYEPSTDPDPSAVLNAVSCAPGTRFCMFVDDSGGAFSYSNGSFGSVADIDGSNGIVSVSCSSSSFCMAIDVNNKVFNYASGKWDTGKQLSTGTHSFNMSFVNVSCTATSTSSSFCVALANTSDGELYYTWKGTTWSSPSSPFDSAGGTTVSLSCTSTVFCLETDEAGFASVFNGSSWSTPQHVDHPSGVSFPVLYSACVGTRCVAVDTQDNFLHTSDGHTWSSAVNIGSLTGMTAKGINSVTCATATLCVAGDGEGDATTYAVPPNPGKPSLTGTPTVGQTLTLTHASVQTTPVWYFDDWFRCDNPGTTCTINPISKSKSSYTLVAADAGKYIDARETVGFGFDEEGFLAGGNLTSNIVGPINAPAVSSVSPNAGPVAGGNTVTINGANFVSGATVQFGALASPSVTFVSASQLKAVAPAHAAGVVGVTVTTPTATSANTSKDFYAYGPPTVSSFSPGSGITGSSVTINGSSYVPGATVKFGSLASPSVTFVSGAQLRAVVPNGLAVAGAISVTTAGGNGSSSTNFTPTFSVTSFSPRGGAAGTSITINGIGFTSGSTVKFNGISSGSVTFVSSVQLKATAPAGGSSGPITVTNTAAPTGAVRSATAYAYPPTVSSFSPGSGITGSSVTINGTNFVRGATVKFGSLASPSVTFVSGAQLKAVVPNGLAMAGAISVTTAGGNESSSTNFTPTFSITSFSPSSGTTGASITINGIGFNGGSTVKFNGAAASSVTFISSTQLHATVPSAATTGPITVTNTTGAIGTVRSATNFTKT